MKKQYKILLVASVITVMMEPTQAQVTIPSNAGGPADYVGWNAAQPFPLTVAHKGNQPIIFQTSAIQRVFMANTAGGVYGNVGIGTLFSTATLPFSNLHIQQDNNNFSFGGGFRPWMQPTAVGTYSGGTGISISNGDNIFLGIRNKTGAFDANDAILDWGDNGGTASQGADFFRFVFTNYNLGVEPGGNVDGLEIMRLSPLSNVGIGDFQINGQFDPQSKLHMHENISQHTGGGTGKSIWFQMTNHDFAPAPTVNNGLKIGILYQNTAAATANAFIYNQENRHLIFSTNHAVPSDAAGMINTTQERVRITSLGAPTTLTSGYGVYNPGASVNTDFTRVAISLNPATPVQRPLSLLHMGYQASGSGNNLDGWRSWMEIGTFTNSNFGVSMYSGLRGAVAPSPDAILSWGYIPSNAQFFSTRMRILFTVPTTGTGIAAGTNGIEAAHFWSDGNNTRMGVGDMQTAGVDPQNTLEIRSSANSPYNGTANASGLRFTNLTSSDVVVANGVNGVNNTKVLTVDQSGDVVLTSAPAGISAADNGLSTNGPTANAIHLGQTYPGGSPAYSGVGSLLNDREIPLNGFDLVFSGLAIPGKDRISIGGAPFSGTDVTTFIDAKAKLSTMNATEDGAAHFYTIYPPTISPVPAMYYGAKGTVIAQHADKKIYALYGQALTSGATVKGIGVYGEAIGNGFNIGVYGKHIGGAASSYAGYFEGDVNVTTTLYANAVFTPSDKRIKEEITTLKDPLAIITKLNPVSYKYNKTYAPQLYVDDKQSYGFIAQEVAALLPELVRDVFILERSDSIHHDKAVTLNSLNYSGLIPFAIGGIQQLNEKLTRVVQEQQATIDRLKHSQDSIHKAVQDQLTKLSAMINSCCRNAFPQNKTPNATDVELTDKDIVVLNQNVPNPFAEQTTISFFIPEKSGFAQIIFHDMKGQIIKVVDVKTKGKGQLNIFANDLSTGMYTYSLHVDGKLMDTKKMVKTD